MQRKTEETRDLPRSTWAGMIERCHNPSHVGYRWYGARGITVCERWRGSFELFAADMGDRPSDDHTLSRIDNDRGYEPDNCRWATWKEQNRNRRGNRVVEAFGEALPLAEWAERIGINYNTLRSRIARGWDIEEMLTRAPTRLRRRKATTRTRVSKPGVRWKSK